MALQSGNEPQTLPVPEASHPPVTWRAAVSTDSRALWVSGSGVWRRAGILRALSFQMGVTP